MRTELPVVSFMCTTLLVCLAPAYWASRSVATLSLIAWLIVCNVIQGVNSIEWAGNNIVKIPVWCDIVTKLLLGAPVALSAACLCLCYRLRRYPLDIDGRSGRNTLRFDCIMCLLLPVIYMALHIIVQDHRFDLVEDFGCTASVYNSVPSFILVWLPPLILPIITIIFACLTCYNHLFFGRAISRIARGSSSPLSLMTLLRPIVASVLTSSFVLTSSAFSIHASLRSIAGLQHWTSLASVHAELPEVDVLLSPATLELLRIQVAWWMIPAASLVLAAVSIPGFIYARDEFLSGYRIVADRLHIPLSRKQASVSTSKASRGLRSRMILRSSDTLNASTSSKSDWDSTMRSKPLSLLNSMPLSISIPDGMPASPPASTASDDSDTTFAQSTMTYLASSEARQALSLPPLVRATQTENKSVLPRAKAFTASTAVTGLHGDAFQEPASRPHDILSEPWPRPPSAIPVSPIVPIAIHPPSPEPTQPRSRPPSTSSLSVSLASSTVSASAYTVDPGNALHDSPTLPHFAPFADAGVPAQQTHDRSMSLAVPKRTHKMRSKDRLVTRNLSLSLRARDKMRDEEEGVEGIHMTVVKETI